MDIDEYRTFALSLPKATEEMPFGPDALVFKVEGKMFALVDLKAFESINLKCDPEKAIDDRSRYEDVKPGYHMNKKHWNSIYMNQRIPDELIYQWTVDSYALVVKKLPKKKQEPLLIALESFEL